MVGALHCVALELLEEGVDSFDARSGHLDGSVDLVHLVCEVATQDGGEYFVLGSEGAVKARFVDAAGFDEIGDGCLAVALLPEQCGEVVKDGLFVEVAGPAAGWGVGVVHTLIVRISADIGTPR